MSFYQWIDLSTHIFSYHGRALGSIEGAKYIYGQFLKGVKESECCPLCSRGYDDAAELKELEEKVP